MRLWELLCEEGKIVPGVNTTQDVKPGETQRQAIKFGFVLDSNGAPPLLLKGASNFTNAKDTINKDPATDLYKKDGTL